MSLDTLPDEVLSKIFFYLLNDPKSLMNLSSTCKRYDQITESLVNSAEWIKTRPFVFNFYLALETYIPRHCIKHGVCAEQQWRVGAKCELSSRNQRKAPLEVKEIDPTRYLNNSLRSTGEEDCYYHRLFCLINSKYRIFSSIKFKRARLSDRGCIKAFQDSLKLDKAFIEHKIRAIVELQLYECEITLDWLNTILDQLEHLKYLELIKVTFIDPTILVESRFLASKKLDRLSIIGDRTYRMTDSTFAYFLDNFPAIELDLSGTTVAYHRRISQRFYPDSTIDHPSECILTFPMVLLYLKKYRAVMNHFIVNETDITLASLEKILKDDELKHLKITVQNCPLITHVEQQRLAERLDKKDFARVTF